MRRLAPALVVALALLTGAAPASAEVLETLTVDPARSAATVGTTTLQQGQRYQLTATGTFTVVGPEGYGFQYDALYCFGGVGFSFVECQPPREGDQFKVAVGGGAWTAIDRLAGTRPPYAASHAYTVEFVAPATGPLKAGGYEAYTGCTTCQSTYTGALTLQLASTQTATAPAPAGCSAGRRARAAAINEVRIVSLAGGVEVRRGADGAWCATEVNAVLGQGDEISTDPEGEIVLAFADNSTVTVRAGTQLRIAAFFTEGGVVRTELLLKNGEIAASVRRSETTPSDFRVRTSVGHTGSVRGTVFSAFADAGGRASVFSVTEGTVDVAAAPGAAPTPITAGQEVAVVGATVSPIAAIGQAGARGGVNRVRAAELALGAIARSTCRVALVRGRPLGVQPTAGGWLVFVRLNGQVRGPSRWSVTAGGATATNRQSRRVARNCR